MNVFGLFIEGVARAGVEPAYGGIKIRCLTTWLPGNNNTTLSKTLIPLLARQLQPNLMDLDIFLL